jgi:hypothetical protein
VKYRKLPTFDRDFRKLSKDEREAFRTFIREQFIPAVKGYEEDVTHFSWPKGLRYEHLNATRGIYAITRSFSGPDGRATFEYETFEGEIFLVWRRIGRHAIYKNP